MPKEETMVRDAVPEPVISMTADFTPHGATRSCSWPEIIKILEEHGFGVSTRSPQAGEPNTNLQR